MNDTGTDSGFAGQPKNQDPWKQRRGARGGWLAITFIVAALVVTVAIIQGAYHRSSRNVPVLPEPRKVASTGAPSPAELSMSFREVAKAVKPAVVYVDVVERPETDPSQLDPFGFPEPRGQRREGAGSGFIVTEDGYILTNNHVVGNASKINVTLADGRKFKATVIGKDAPTDLAVIKIEAAGLPVAVLAHDSDEVEQGDWVLALGSPFGLQQTLTAGIVSATGRELRDGRNNQMFSRFIQTDASINPGNSGGPLVNLKGEVIGINTMILTGGPFSQGNIGIGFAIASNGVRNVFPTLVKNGRVSRGYLGVLVSDLDQAHAHALRLEPNTGVFVSDVKPNSPADKAGLQAKDVITALNGKPVKAGQELTDAVASTPVGQQARVDFIRNGQAQSVTVELAERPADPSARAIPRGQGDEDPDAVQQSRLGIQARTITPEIADQIKPKLKTASGALVVAVQPNSPGADAGVQHGDVIHNFDQTAIKTVEDLVNAVRSIQPGDYLIEVERKGQTVFLKVTIE